MEISLTIEFPKIQAVSGFPLLGPAALGSRLGTGRDLARTVFYGFSIWGRVILDTT